MRIGIVKPDYGITGGFELLLRRQTEELEQRGHRVSWRMIEVAGLDRRPFNIDVPDEVWEAQPEFFRYLRLVDAFATMRVPDVDVVVSSQPPSFAVEHPRHLWLCSHQFRIYYDLSDVYVEAGFAPDPAVHAAAEAAVRRVDDEHLARVGWVLATSEEVQDRLRRFNGLGEDRVSVYHAGVGVQPSAPVEPRWDFPLCVSRHEFPKRTELFVHAMKLLPKLRGVSVGAGGRLPWVQSVDARLSRMGPDELAQVDDRPLWLSNHAGAATEPAAEDSNVSFVGHVSDDELTRLYAEALCVVAPAYLEDYGLTAIEAMHHGKPVVVCKDGGGLVNFVEDGVNGLVVEPTGAAIAAAVQRLREEPGLAQALGEGARETALQYTWARAMDEFAVGLERVAS